MYMHIDVLRYLVGCFDFMSSLCCSMKCYLYGTTMLRPQTSYNHYDGNKDVISYITKKKDMKYYFTERV